MVAIMMALALEAAMEAMEMAVICLHIIHQLLHLAWTCIHRLVCQCLEIVQMQDGGLFNIHTEMVLVWVRQQEILLHCPLEPVPHSLLHQVPTVKLQLVLLDIMVQLPLQEAAVMDRLLEKWLQLHNLIEEKVGGILEVINLKIVHLQIGKDNPLMVLALTNPRKILQYLVVHPHIGSQAGCSNKEAVEVQQVPQP